MRDDRAVAGAIGLVLMLAVAVTAYAQAVRTKLPVYGEEAERAWEDDVAGAFHELGRSVAEGARSGAPSSTTLPQPPVPRSIDLPFLGSAAPLPPSGAVRYEPACASVSASHELGDGTVIDDLQGASTGCIAFEATPVYSTPFAYRHELGGLLRLQSGRAVVLAGPPLDLAVASPQEYRVSFAMEGLRGEARTASNDAADVQVDITPGPAASEVEQAPNARKATWTFDTDHPAAWRTWYSVRFSQAGFVTDSYTVACDPVDCSTASGTGRVIVTITGPRTDAQEDLKLSITYGLADVNIR